MPFNYIIFDIQDDLATLTLNRPEVSNGFNIPTCQEILQALTKVKDNPSVRFLMIKAVGKVFSVGGDLVEMQTAVEKDDVQSLVKIAELVQEISFAIKQLPKPVILCADGAVAGAAFNIALAADFCIASTQTKFIQAFVNVGLAPDAGGLFLLTRAVGLNRATHLVMTGEGVTAEKGLDYGFVYRAAESDKLDKVCLQLLKRLRRGSSNSYAGMKTLVWQSFFTGWEEYAKKELDIQEELAFKEDFKEGVRAYGERRRPNFQGK
ncbi:enoyl-CoA hydratase [Streptococcus dysgalactiae]|uniref:Enoyl-CoA hydratase n=1 Tax=Streptococcus dysgalactiae subsp. dysgalactiae TaxID=99822 RepID=A0A9X7RY05_STRDY|nr:enoyl-CoA hydratase [Streptococcus dysgalactiae]MSU86122.1 enoyl-CoA hydratase [Streptococcus dysgalactiae subsp. dysgalactiae]QGG98325.1 enoyl-CoA hydratase [Streptococcus dysgalactiae subsp. dysgalactiae]QGH02647.1 enoyl-CoA hydratase [Streptococcus dysgalactiae subsp. dysgalactiae]